MTQPPDIAVFYEHPEWFKATFAALERRGVSFVPLTIQDHVFDPADPTTPASVVFNRLAMSSFLRQSEHATFYTQAVLEHWARNGARVINGAGPMGVDASKARQLSLFRSLGLDVPATFVVHRRADVVRAAAKMAFPLMVKVNIGGSGAGMVRYDTLEELRVHVDEGTIPSGIDGVTLVQDYVPARGGRVIRCEVLDGRFLYAIALDGAGSTFDLCPADVCMVDKPTISISQFAPPPAMIDAAERIARSGGFDICGVEYMIDDRDGKSRFYDVNGLSNFVANPLEVLGWDPHEKLVDYLIGQIATTRKAAA